MGAQWFIKRRVVSGGYSILICYSYLLLYWEWAYILSPQLRGRLLMLVVASSTTLVLAVVLVIMLSLEGFTGISSAAPLLLNACAAPYFAAKYSAPNNGIAAVYVASLLSIFFQIAVCVLLFPPLIMRAQPAARSLAAAYLLVALHSLSALLAFGKNLAYQVDLHSMGASCSLSYSEVLVQVVLACAAADFAASLLQALFMLLTAATFSAEREKAEKYRAAFSATHQTVENMIDDGRRANIGERMPFEISRVAAPCENVAALQRDPSRKPGPAEPKFERKETELAQTNKEAYSKEAYSKEAFNTFSNKEAFKNKDTHSTIRPAEPRFQRKDTEAFKFFDQQMGVRPRPQVMGERRRDGEQANSSSELARPAVSAQQERIEDEMPMEKYPHPARVNRKRASSNFEEESQQSLAVERKAVLEQLANAPGPIYSASKRDIKEQVNRSTRGYLHFVRRMNASQNSITETEGELIATIRGKYAK